MKIEIDENTSLELGDGEVTVRGLDGGKNPRTIIVPVNDKALLAVDTFALLLGIKKPEKCMHPSVTVERATGIGWCDACGDPVSDGYED